MVTWPIVPRRSANGMSLLMLLALTCSTSPVAISSGHSNGASPLVVVRHAVSYHLLATVRAPKSMWLLARGGCLAIPARKSARRPSVEGREELIILGGRARAGQE